MLYLSKANLRGLPEQTVGSWIAFDTHQPIKHKQPSKCWEAEPAPSQAALAPPGSEPGHAPWAVQGPPGPPNLILLHKSQEKRYFLTAQIKMKCLRFQAGSYLCHSLGCVSELRCPSHRGRADVQPQWAEQHTRMKYPGCPPSNQPSNWARYDQLMTVQQ